MVSFCFFFSRLDVKMVGLLKKALLFQFFLKNPFYVNWLPGHIKLNTLAHLSVYASEECFLMSLNHVG